ncbi:MAG TPA: O-antigen ligase family protein [Xanthobacteraceae bacterium]|nr:O-antigen ligase family protein [Xanthobacteraceae bacterium]
MAARSPTVALPSGYTGGSAAFAERLLNFVLFITVLLSSIAFIEPSPHDVMMFVLLVTCVAARVPFDRQLTPLLILIIIWLVGCAMSVIQVINDEKAVQYFGTSVYLGIAAILFACLFSDGDATRLQVLRRAYLLSAVLATFGAYIGFFHLLPGADIFMDGDRPRATFKDPNVYAPFLIFPILMLMIRQLTRGIRLFDLGILLFLLGGLLLSFSRGAWVHFAVSASVCFMILVVVTPEPRTRSRMVLLGVVALILVAALLTAFLSIDSVRDLFVERAKVIQPYDVGPGGRFTEQRLALSVILDHPNGMGPFGFGNTYGMQQHNVYMQGFLVYGWLGGAIYLTLVAATLMIGLRAVLMRSPWQPYLIAAYAVFVGELVEGMIVDTDHWRHFFLMIGLIWGLMVANQKAAGRLRPGPA